MQAEVKVRNFNNENYIYVKTETGQEFLFTEYEQKNSRKRVQFLLIEHHGREIPVEGEAFAPATAEPPKEETMKEEFKIPKLGFVETEHEIRDTMYAIQKQKNVLLKGPTGCGKTFLVEELAKHFNKKLYTVNCDIELDKSEIIGKYEVKDGKTVWVQGILPQAMQEGAWIIWDEVNTGKPEVFSSCHSALDHRRTLTIKEHQNEQIVAHPDFRVFATMNPDYAGTMDLNYAFRRRFQVIIPMDYLNPEDEKKLIIKMSGVAEEIADRLIKVGIDTRKMHKEGKLTHPVSTAHLIEFARVLKFDNFDPVECARITLNISDEHGEMEDVLNVVRNYF